MNKLIGLKRGSDTPPLLGVILSDSGSQVRKAEIKEFCVSHSKVGVIEGQRAFQQTGYRPLKLQVRQEEQLQATRCSLLQQQTSEVNINKRKLDFHISFMTFYLKPTLEDWLSSSDLKIICCIYRHPSTFIWLKLHPCNLILPVFVKHIYQKWTRGLQESVECCGITFSSCSIHTVWATILQAAHFLRPTDFC